MQGVPWPTDLQAVVPTDAVSRYFQAIGRAVELAWPGPQAHGAEFSEVATQVLSEIEVPEGVNERSVLAHALQRDVTLPPQPDPDALFGDPPLTLYATEQFFVSALYWLDGTTSIHEHSFSGAFRVLVGSSLHSVYEFDPAEETSSSFALGSLRLRHSEHLRAGDVRTIASGHGLVHSLFHLDRPSVSLVVRTYRDGPRPQLSYEVPGIAYDPMDPPVRRRQAQALRSLARWDTSAANEAARELIPAGPDHAWWVLRSWFGAGPDAILADLIGAVEKAFGPDVAAPFDAALVERQRQRAIINRRRMVRTADHRLFLALLLNLPDWSTIRNVLGSIMPTSPAEDVIERWLAELTAPDLRGASGLQITPAQVQEVVASLRSGSSDQLAAVSGEVRRYQLLSSLLR